MTETERFTDKALDAMQNAVAALAKADGWLTDASLALEGGTAGLRVPSSLQHPH